MNNKQYQKLLLEFLRDVDWHLAVIVDSVKNWLQADWQQTKADIVNLCSSANAGLSGRLRRLLVHPYRTQFLTLTLLACVIAAISAQGRQEETPDQPISHIYAKVSYDLRTLGARLNPISSADAALPDFAGQDISGDGDSNQRLSPEANNSGEQSLDDTPKSKTVTLGKGASLSRALIKAGASKADANAISAALKKTFDPRRLTHGEDISIEFMAVPDAVANEAGVVVSEISFTPSAEKRIMVLRQEDGQYRAKTEARALTTKQNVVNVTIAGSLSSSAKRAGVPRAVLSEVTRVLSYDVDFQRDVHPGDRLQVMFEQVFDEDGELVRTGALLYVGLQYGKKELNIYRYAPKGERADYFHENGRSVRKALLKTPIDGAKITSGFGMRRHPILGYSKMHEGVDFAAPMGTPIIAAGDGTVVQKGWNGGYGHYVEIRHNREFSTAYAHLSRYYKNLRVGQKIRQGDVIGYLGSTGLSTGPHLHYEVIKSGNKVNPVGVKFATGTALAGKDFQGFKLQVAAIERGIKTAAKAKASPKIASR